MSGRSPRPFFLFSTLLILASTAMALTAPGAEEVRTLVAGIQRAVEEIRGLPFKQAVPVELADDTVARRYFEARMRTYWPESRMRVEQDAYIDLGLLPE